MSLTAHTVATIPTVNYHAFRMWRTGSTNTTSTQDWYKNNFSAREKKQFRRGEIDIEKRSLTN